MNDVDDNFFERADEHINLSNEHLSSVNRGKVSASMMYGNARFSAWVSACGFDNSNDMKNAKEDMVKYFVSEFEKMLSENLDDYIDNFDKYMKV